MVVQDSEKSYVDHLLARGTEERGSHCVASNEGLIVLRKGHLVCLYISGEGYDPTQLGLVLSVSSTVVQGVVRATALVYWQKETKKTEVSVLNMFFVEKSKEGKKVIRMIHQDGRVGEPVRV